MLPNTMFLSAHMKERIQCSKLGKKSGAQRAPRKKKLGAQQKIWVHDRCIFVIVVCKCRKINKLVG